MSATAAAVDANFSATGRESRNRATLRVWLGAVIVLLFALVMVGGATRLTDSGLSITEWKPIHGIVPPLNDAEWQEEFAKYRETPEFREINADMDLAGFKTIFWWEWAHRALARSIGVVFALPLAFFWITGRVERALKPKLLGILALGGLQGAIGWWMVASGLVARTDVSQYRLAVHLTVAALIFAATVAVARGLVPDRTPPAHRRTQGFAGWLVVAALVQIYLGGLVAGLDAGYAYNTWPLMDGRLVPSSLFAIEPLWRNLFENPQTVQFMHRLGGYLLLGLTLWHMISTVRRERGTPHARRAVILFHLVLVQAAIGVTALLLVVPLSLGLLHQAGALVVLGFAAAHWRGTRGSYPLPAGAASTR